MKRLVIIPILLIALSGCASLEKHEPTARLVTQYAVLKYAEKLPADSRAARIERIRTIAIEVKAMTTGETSLSLLQLAVASQLDKAGLSPADRLLADGLVQIISAELEERIGTGVLAPEQLVQVSEVMDWIIAATNVS